MERRLIILGSTGSIGSQAADVVEHLNGLQGGDGSWRVVGLAAGSDGEKLARQAHRLGVRELALANGDCPGYAARSGPDAAERLVREVECDLVLAAIVGSAGLPATLAAVELGRDVALANKEALVAAGGLVVAAAKRSRAAILPIDSEHAGAWQCLLAAVGRDRPPTSRPRGVRRLTLTASGGPFRTWDKARIDAATPDEALRHPTWSMGRKVTIDSATLINKALEVIEAHHLFGLPGDAIDAVVHPQSVVHALAEYDDGSVIAQMAHTDMRGPIQLTLDWPRRRPGLTRPLDLASLGRLDFEPVDHARFPGFALAHRAIREGGAAGAVLNAANEEAVAAFLAGRIRFGRIAPLVASAMDASVTTGMSSLDECLDADRRARAFVRDEIRRG